MSRRTIAAMIAAFVAALGGCAVGPRYAPPTPSVPDAWRDADAIGPGGGADEAWWKGFGDAEMDSLIGRALASDLDVRQAVLRIDAARAQRKIAAAGAWPSVNAGAAFADTRISERTATSSIFSALSGGAGGATLPGITGSLPGLANPYPQYQYGLTASWELDLFGRIRRQVEAADAETGAAVEDARAVRVSLMAEVASVYIDLRSAQARLAVDVETVATLQQVLALAENARAAGLGDDLDVVSGKAALAGAQATLAPLRSEISADRDQLALLLAAPPGALDQELAEAGPVPPAPAEVAVGLPSALARRRPDIRAAEDRLHAAVAMQGVAVAALYPRITLGASGGLEASNPASLDQWAARYFGVGPSIDLPVFDAGQRRANVRLSGVQARSAALAYAQTVLVALHEVDDAITAYDQERARRDALEAARDQSQAALDLAQVRYRAGAVSFRDVLEAQGRLQAAELTLAASTGATSEDLVALYRALGGGWRAGEAG